MDQPLALFQPPTVPDLSDPSAFGPFMRDYNVRVGEMARGARGDLTKLLQIAKQISPWRNRLINPNFVVNRMGYVSNTNLAAGAYGHDGWKAGAGGCTYTFTQLANSTQITITAGTLIQVVEDKAVEGGAYVASWTGTAQGRVGIDTATPAGSYTGAPLRWVNTAGTTTSIEFGTGTLSEVNLQPGRNVLPFASRPFASETLICERYFPVFLAVNGAAGDSGGPGESISATIAVIQFMFRTAPRVAPTGATVTNAGSFYVRDVNGNPVALTALAYRGGGASFVDLTATVAGGLVAGSGTTWGTTLAAVGKIVFTGAQL